jgi:hypothetical protein
MSEQERQNLIESFKATGYSADMAQQLVDKMFGKVKQ